MAKNSTKGNKPAETTAKADDFVDEQAPAVEAAKAKAAQDDATAEANAEQTIRKDVVPQEYRERYAATGGNNGDFIAEELSIVTKDGGIDSLKTIKAENGIEANRWAGFNNGMMRMNIANVLRAAFLRGETIKIVGKEFSIPSFLDQYGQEVDYNNESAVGKFVQFMNLTDNERTRKQVAKALAPKRDIEAERAEKAKKREEEKAAKAAEREKVANEKKAEREKAAAEKAAEREKAKADKAAERETARKQREADREAAKAAKAAPTETATA